MDYEIRKMKNQLVGVLNNAPLPIEVKRLALAELLREVEQKANEIISQQIQAENNKTETEEVEENAD